MRRRDCTAAEEGGSGREEAETHLHQEPGAPGHLGDTLGAASGAPAAVGPDWETRKYLSECRAEPQGLSGLQDLLGDKR